MDKEDLRRTADEVYIEAFVTNIPTIIVEGRDDITFYNRICDAISKKTLVVAIELIQGYSEGCADVVRIVEDLQIQMGCEKCEPYILGIIDKDVREYREDYDRVIMNPSLLMLKYYSYESHLLTKAALKKVVSEELYVRVELITDELIEYIQSGLPEELQSVYYISLEALKNACCDGYDSLAGYKQKSIESIVRNEDKMNQLLDKKQELDEFASQQNITYSEECVKQFVKGKWLLHAYAQYILNIIKKLPQLCLEHKIQQCSYCKVGKYDKCEYRTRTNFQENALIARLEVATIQLDEVMYIKERIMQLI